MGLIFLFLKIFPFFGLATTIGCFDLARSYRRKGSPSWIAFLFFSMLFFILTALWIIYRGDKNADLWFAHVSNMMSHSE